MPELNRKVRVKLEYRVEYRNPIELAAGDRVIVGREDDEFPGWKWCKASNGREGWVPLELLFTARLGSDGDGGFKSASFRLADQD